MGAGQLQHADGLQVEELIGHEESGQFQVIWKRFSKHRLAVLGGIVLLFFISVAILAPVLAPQVPVGSHTAKLEGAWLSDPYFVDLPNKHIAPGEQGYILGTDEVGRDELSRLIYGAQISLYVGIMATLGSEIFGAVLGAVSGYYGGVIDSILMRITDFILTLPLLPILLILSAMLSSVVLSAIERVNMLIFILIAFGWTTAARLVRGVVLSLRQQEFTEASRALGASDLRIIAQHMLPNALAPIIVNATLGVGGNIITEAALSFLGFGVQSPLSSWGNMLARVQEYMLVNPTLAIWPGLCIFLTVLSINFIGDGLRDALDPRMRGRGA
jgi:peptide/nickel transport system permease protein